LEESLKPLDQLSINTLRFLAVDAIEAANSGHPGLPLGAAPMAYVIWDRFLRHNPKNPAWFNRDRFVLSAGHGSALLYALLHLYGYDLPIEEVKRFRQWGSKTPGHPEQGETAGVEATTGPLGQGFAMGVGMAIAEAHLAKQFNQDGFPIVDHYTYALISDGDLMEGISAEAASLAGTLGLGKLIYLYDDNHISIEGDTKIAFRENVLARFDAYGWHTQRVADGNDLDGIEAAIKAAQAETGKPSIIAVRTQIGFGSPKQGTAGVHGEPLGAKNTEETKKNLNWPAEPKFLVPDEARAHCAESAKRGAELEAKWNALQTKFAAAFPEAAALAKRMIAGELPTDLTFPRYEEDKKGMATRASGGKVQNAIASALPELVGGSADLTPSTKTNITTSGDFSAEDRAGRNLHFGIREFAMGAALNGMALHGGVIPYGSTFMVFSDYARAAIRLAAIMQTHTVWVFTHDSIGVGEDGPTHQPVEQVMSMRMIPGMTVLRPADANETSASWKIAVEKHGPVVLALTRQNVPTLPDARKVFEGTLKGAYVYSGVAHPDVVLIGTGSELSVAIEAANKLAETGVKVQVVSMPSWELFDAQPESYRAAVLPPEVPRVAVEAGIAFGWQKYIGPDGAIVAMEKFGASGNGNEVMKQYGFTPENVAAVVQSVLAKKAKKAAAR
jgi:transketolase